MDTPNLETTPRERQMSNLSKLEIDLIPIDLYHNTTRLILVCISLCLASFNFGFNLTFLSNVQLSTMKDFFGTLASKQSTIGFLIGILCIGAAFGALLAPFFMKFVSRKNFLVLFNIIGIIVAGVIQVNNLIVLTICRFLQGFIIGNFMAITPIYINQLVPIPLQGSYGAFIQVLLVIGVVSCYTMGVIFQVTNLEPQFVWRFLFSFTGLISIIQLILFFTGFIPESPVSLIEKGQVEEAKRILLMFNTKNALDKAYFDASSKAQRSQIAKVIDSQKLSTERNQQNLVVLDSRTSLKAFYLGFQLPFMQQISGVTMIVTQIGYIVSNYDASLALYAPLIANIIQLAGAVSSVWMLKYFGRKPLMLFGNFSLAIIDIIVGAMFLLMFLNSEEKVYVYVALILIVIFMPIFACTIGPVVWLYVPEIIPARLVPPATFTNWLCSSICVIATPYITEAVGSSYPIFFFFGGVTLILGITNWLLMVETKGLSPTQISKQFKI